MSEPSKQPEVGDEVVIVFNGCRINVPVTGISGAPPNKTPCKGCRWEDRCREPLSVRTRWLRQEGGDEAWSKTQ